MTDTNSSKELDAGGYLAAYFYRVPKRTTTLSHRTLRSLFHGL
jgi:hypothetical protein